MENTPSSSQFKLWLQDFFLVLSKCWLSIIMLLFGIYAFLLNGQGQDIVTAFNENQHWGLPILTALCIFFWGIESWFGARIGLNIADLTSLNKSEDIKMQKWVPRALGLLSIAVFYISYLCNKDEYWWGDLVILFTPFILYWFIIVKRRQLVRKLNENEFFKKLKIRFDILEIKSSGEKYKNLNVSGKRFLLIPVILFPLLIIALCIWPVSFPSSCTPSVVIILGVAIWTGLASALSVLEKIHKLPLVIIIALFMLFFSLMNNNHTARTLPDTTVTPEPIADNIKKWVNSIPANSDSSKTIYLVCGEGGGIRAGYWTASVLASLTDSVKDFSNHLYALSTVSGSSLGASIYNSLLYAQQKNILKDDSLSKYVRSFMGQDYLSPVAAAFLFPDMLQRLLPVPVGAFDRARYLEYSWEKGWSNTITEDMNPFSGGTYQLWKDTCKIPNLFLNSTHTEDGRRVIASNLKWDETNWQARNISALIGKDMPLSTSTLLSARFPVITPGAKIVDKEEVYWGTLVDGGYYDNYGVVTINDIYDEIRTIYPKHNELKVVVLCIRNGDKVPENPEPIRIAYELQTVPATFLNTWSIRPEKSLNMLEQILTLNKDTLITVDLSRSKKENLPLGWFLSDKAMDIMDGQLKTPEWHQKKKSILDLMK